MTLSSKNNGGCSGEFLPLKLSCHAHRGNQHKRSFDTHIWMLETLLGKLVGERESRDDLKTFESYVIAASFPKMLHRMNGGRISKRYFDCLKRLESTSFEFLEQPDIETTISTPSDQPFLNLIPTLDASTKNLVPNLKTMAEKIATNTEKPDKIYNKDTYMEFHILLCRLLIRFHTSLERLEALFSANSNNLMDIKLKLKTVSVFGRNFRAMVRGTTIDKHLKTIANLLDVDCGGSREMPMKTEELKDDEEDEDEDLEPYSMSQGGLLPWQSYKDWLRLTTLYFDAISILQKHVSKLPSEAAIDIKILAPSLPDKRMLPWKELLCHDVYFPKLIGDSTSVEDLITFLTNNFDGFRVPEGTLNEREEGSSITTAKGKGTRFKKNRGFDINLVIEAVKKIVNLQETSTIEMDGFNKDVDLVVDEMELLNNWSAPGCQWHEYATKVISPELKGLKDSNLSSQERLTQTRSVLEMFQTLRGNTLLYQQLREGTPLSRGDGFLGCSHCEVRIASLVSLSSPGDDPHLKAILPEFLVSQISCLARIFVENLQYTRELDKP